MNPRKLSSSALNFDDIFSLAPKAYNFIQRDLFKAYQNSRSLTALEAYIGLKSFKWRLVENGLVAYICWSDKLEDPLLVYNYKFNEKLPVQTVGFIILHEYLHIYLKHPKRVVQYLKEVPYELILILTDIEVNMMLGLTGKSLAMPKPGSIGFLEDFLPLPTSFFPSIQTLKTIMSKKHLTIKDISILENLIETYNNQGHVEISLFYTRKGISELLSKFPNIRYLGLSKDKFLVPCIVSSQKFFEDNKHKYPNSIWFLIEDNRDYDYNDNPNSTSSEDSGESGSMGEDFGTSSSPSEGKGRERDGHRNDSRGGRGNDSEDKKEANGKDPMVVGFSPEQKERMIKTLIDLIEEFTKVMQKLENIHKKIIEKLVDRKKDSNSDYIEIPGSGIGSNTSEGSSNRVERSRTLYEYMRSIDYHINRYFESLHRKGITFWEFRGKYSPENSRILDDLRYTPIPTESDCIVNNYPFKITRDDTKVYGVANIVVDVSGSMSAYVEPCVYMIIPSEGERFRNIYYVTQIDTEIQYFIRLSDHSDKQNFVVSFSGGGTDLYPAVRYLYSEFNMMPKTEKTNINRAYEYYSEFAEEIRKMIPLVLITDGFTPTIDLKHIDKDTPVFVVIIDSLFGDLRDELIRFDSLSEMVEKLGYCFLEDFDQRPGGLYVLCIGGSDLINAYNDILKK